MQLYQITWALAVAALIVEILLPGFLFLGFALGLAMTGLLHFITGEFSVVRDVLVFGLSSAAGFWGLRKIFRKPDDAHDGDNDVNQY